MNGKQESSLSSNQRGIVDRLRHSAAVNRSGGFDGDAEEREEAADEIERLTRERDVWKSKAIHRGESASRLRAALQIAAEELAMYVDFQRKHDYLEYADQSQRKLDAINAALSGDPPSAPETPKSQGCETWQTADAHRVLFRSDIGCPYCEIERLTRERDEEREMRLSAERGITETRREDDRLRERITTAACHLEVRDPQQALAVLHDALSGDLPSAPEMKDNAEDELIERMAGLIEHGTCSYAGCVDGAYPSARDGQPIPCMWHDERAVLLHLVKERSAEKASPSISMEGQPMGDPHPCDLTRAGCDPVTGKQLKA